MHPQFVDSLCCLEIGNTLTLEVEETNDNNMVASGQLVTGDGTAHPIVRGIPRLVGQCSISNYAIGAQR